MKPIALSIILLCLLAETCFAKDATFKCTTVTSSNYEICFIKAKNLMLNSKTRKKGVILMSKIMYVKDKDYVIGAILELSLLSRSKTAISHLYKKALSAISSNSGDILEHVTSALINLKADKEIFKLVKYTKKRKKPKLTQVISQEYLAFKSGKEFLAMEKLAGKIYD